MCTDSTVKDSSKEKHPARAPRPYIKNYFRICGGNLIFGDKGHIVHYGEGRVVGDDDIDDNDGEHGPTREPSSDLVNPGARDEGEVLAKTAKQAEYEIRMQLLSMGFPKDAVDQIVGKYPQKSPIELANILMEKDSEGGASPRKSPPSYRGFVTVKEPSHEFKECQSEADKSVGVGSEPEDDITATGGATGDVHLSKRPQDSGVSARNIVQSGEQENEIASSAHRLPQDMATVEEKRRYLYSMEFEKDAVDNILRRYPMKNKTVLTNMLLEMDTEGDESRGKSLPHRQEASVLPERVVDRRTSQKLQSERETPLCEDGGRERAIDGDIKYNTMRATADVHTFTQPQDSEFESTIIEPAATAQSERPLDADDRESTGDIEQQLIEMGFDGPLVRYALEKFPGTHHNITFLANVLSEVECEEDKMSQKQRKSDVTDNPRDSGVDPLAKEPSDPSCSIEGQEQDNDGKCLLYAEARSGNDGAIESPTDLLKGTAKDEWTNNEQTLKQMGFEEEDIRRARDLLTEDNVQVLATYLSNVKTVGQINTTAESESGIKCPEQHSTISENVSTFDDIRQDEKYANEEPTYFETRSRSDIHGNISDTVFDPGTEDLPAGVTLQSRDQHNKQYASIDETCDVDTSKGNPVSFDKENQLLSMGFDEKRVKEALEILPEETVEDISSYLSLMEVDSGKETNLPSPGQHDTSGGSVTCDTKVSSVSESSVDDDEDVLGKNDATNQDVGLVVCGNPDDKTTSDTALRPGDGNTGDGTTSQVHDPDHGQTDYTQPKLNEGDEITGSEEKLVEEPFIGFQEELLDGASNRPSLVEGECSKETKFLAGGLRDQSGEVTMSITHDTPQPSMSKDEDEDDERQNNEDNKNDPHVCDNTGLDTTNDGIQGEEKLAENDQLDSNSVYADDLRKKEDSSSKPD
ncbi:uncharacterized protein LOC144437942 [Glandiceps talaboti]